MYYHWQTLLFSIALCALSGNGRLVSGARIPSRGSNLMRREDASTTMVEVPRLGDLAQYVCSNDANSVKRQASGSTKFSVPIAQLENILLALQEIELDILILMNELLQEGALGLATPSEAGPAAVSISVLQSSIEQAISTSHPTPTSITVENPATTVDPVLSATPTLNVTDLGDCDDDIPTPTTQATQTITTPSITVIMRDPGDDSTTDADCTTMTLISLETTTVPTNVDAVSTTATFFADPSTTLANVAAPSTTTTDSGSASTSSLTGPAAPTSSAGGIFIQTSIGSATTADEGASTPSFTGPTGVSSSSGGTSLQTSTGSAATSEPTASNDYVFDAQSSKNVAVYFGQTPVTGGTSLKAQCADPNIDIVILAFVISNTFGGQYPVVNFGAACGGQTPEMIAEAPGLLYCPDLANDITACQSTYGKRVLLSIGGSASQISLTSPAMATSFADTLWDLFGPTGNVDIGLRPFGAVEVDGFDVDNEDNLPSNFDVLAQALRTHFTTLSTKRAVQKKYYLSSAPQCPFPDASNPAGLILLCDFVWVQFYNNPPCEIGSSNFAASVDQWSSFLENSTLETKPRLYVGAPAFAAAGASAYGAISTAEGMQSTASGVGKLGLSNLGGFMFWDGPEGRLNIESGKSILAWAKQGLEST